MKNSKLLKVYKIVENWEIEVSLLTEREVQFHCIVHKRTRVHAVIKHLNLPSSTSESSMKFLSSWFSVSESLSPLDSSLHVTY